MTYLKSKKYLQFRGAKLLLGAALGATLGVQGAWAEEIVGTDGPAVESPDVVITAVPTPPPAPGSVVIVPASPTFVSNCIPFGGNIGIGFTGFIYRGVAPFSLSVGGLLRFDLGRLNNQAIQRDIFLATANIDPALVGPTLDVVSQGIKVDASGWTQVVLEAQVPLNSTGNAVSGDYELTYTADFPFSHSGGGLIVGFRGFPPATIADGGCEQVLVRTDGGDASGSFYARFFGRLDLSLAVLDSGGGGTGIELGGIIIEPGLIQIDIDIKPGSFPNSINLGSGGATPVAILGSDTFDVLDVDTSTLTLGTSGVKTVGKVKTVGNKDHQLCSIEDVSGDFDSAFGLEGVPDGFDDLVCHFITVDIVPEAGETDAKISGELMDGTAFEGTDSVNIVPAP